MKLLLRPLFKKLYHLLYKNGKTITINNEQYKVSAHIARGINKNIDEPPYNILKKLSTNANIVFDVGASNGIISLLLSKHMNKNSSIYSFEPTPSIFNILKDNAKVQNGNANIIPYNLAISSENGFLHFKQTARKTMNYVVKEKTSDTIDVKCTTLDSFVNTYKISPDVIKIDVEGWEYNVLLGGRELLKRHNCKLLIEMHQDILRNNGVTRENFNSLISDLGYISYGKDGNELNSPFDADWVLLLSKSKLPKYLFE